MAMIFPFAPDWSADVIERLSWLTDVIPAAGGGEQRVRVREGARRTIEFQVVLGGDRERVSAHNIIGAAAGDVLLPLWLDAPWLVAAAPSTTDVVPVHTTVDHDLAVGDDVALLHEGASEQGVVAAVAAGSVDLVEPLQATWPAGARLAPLVPAQLRPDVQLVYPSDNTGRSTFTFDLVGEWIGTPAAETADYRGYTVLLPQTDWTEEVGDDLQHTLQVFDGDTGARSTTATTGVLKAQRVHRWALDGRPAIAAFRAWLAARAGRLVPFWQPSNQADLRVMLDIGSSATTITVEDRGFWRHFAGGERASAIGRRDLMLVSSNGTRWFRRITNAQPMVDGRELITIDSALGSALPVSAVQMVSVMRLVRLAADTVEIAYSTDALARVALGLVSVVDGVSA